MNTEIKFDFDLALVQLGKRKAENLNRQIDNCSLPAGSPMYFYCKFCGVETAVLPELYLGKVKKMCDPCEILHLHGLI